MQKQKSSCSLYLKKKQKKTKPRKDKLLVKKRLLEFLEFDFKMFKPRISK